MKSRLILSGLILVAASLSQAAYLPIPIQSSSYNADAIIESNATPRLDVVTTATVDNGTNNTSNTWIEQCYDTGNPDNVLPPTNTVFTAQDNAYYTYRIPPANLVPHG